jgi:hypothetical protein
VLHGVSWFNFNGSYATVDTPNNSFKTVVEGNVHSSPVITNEALITELWYITASVEEVPVPKCTLLIKAIL